MKALLHAGIGVPGRPGRGGGLILLWRGGRRDVKAGSCSLALLCVEQPLDHHCVPLLPLGLGGCRTEVGVEAKLTNVHNKNNNNINKL